MGILVGFLVRMTCTVFLSPSGQCSTHLLNTLWDSLQFYDTMGTTGAAMVRVIRGEGW